MFFVLCVVLVFEYVLCGLRMYGFGIFLMGSFYEILHVVSMLWVILEGLWYVTGYWVKVLMVV